MDEYSQDADRNVEFEGGHLYPGQWHYFEQHIKLNTVSNGVANNDGEYRWWINGDLIYERTNLRWTHDLENNAIEYSGPYIGYGGGEESPQYQEVYHDEHRIFVDADVPTPDKRPLFTETNRQ